MTAIKSGPRSVVLTAANHKEPKSTIAKGNRGFVVTMRRSFSFIVVKRRKSVLGIWWLEIC